MALKRRYTITLENARFDRTNKAIRYGQREELVGKILDMIVAAIESDGQSMVGAILDGKVKLVVVDGQGT
jgi:hypothetical protein